MVGQSNGSADVSISGRLRQISMRCGVLLVAFILLAWPFLALAVAVVTGDTSSTGDTSLISYTAGPVTQMP